MPSMWWSWAWWSSGIRRCFQGQEPPSYPGRFADPHEDAGSLSKHDYPLTIAAQPIIAVTDRREELRRSLRVRIEALAASAP
jgi:hypothetical protein